MIYTIITSEEEVIFLIPIIMKENAMFRKDFMCSPCEEAEEKFLDFCRKNKIQYKTNYDQGTRQNIYTAVFVTYLDALEKKVVERCKELGIKYTFYRDKDVHHYNFSTMVTFDDARLANYDNIYDNRYNKYQSRDSKPVQPKTWLEKLLGKLGLAKSKVKEEMDYFFESLGFPEGFTEENVQRLKKMSLPNDDF